MTTIIAGLLMLSVLVVVHEFGHFIVARLFGVGVPVFSVGMGPRLIGFRWGETDYRLSMIPVGGYVQMSGADPFGAEDPDSYVPPEQDFMKKPIWQRLAILFAGPAFNLVLPFVAFTAVMMLGEPTADNTIGSVRYDSVADRAGIEPGEAVIAVNGAATDTWREAALAIRDLSADADIQLTVRNATGGTRDVTLPAMDDSDRYLGELGLDWLEVSSRVGVADVQSPAGRAGLRTADAITAVDGLPVTSWEELMDALGEGGSHELSFRRAAASESGESLSFSDDTVTIAADPSWTPAHNSVWDSTWGFEPIMVYVRGFQGTGSRAQEAGVRLGDRFLAVDGQPVNQWDDLLGLVMATAPPPSENTAQGCGEAEHVDAERSLELTLLRDNEVITLEVTPKMQREARGPTVYYRPLIGVLQDPSAFVAGDQINKRYGFGPSLGQSVSDVKLMFTGTLSVLGQTLTGGRKLDESVGGPVEIFRLAGASARSSWFDFVRLMGGISLSLGIVNLLPVPALDGGQIVVYAIEGIRGRPLSLRLRERIQMVGVLALVALILVVTFNDITRALTGG